MHFPTASRSISTPPGMPLIFRAYVPISGETPFQRAFFSKLHQHFAQFSSSIFVRSSSLSRRNAQKFLCILYKTSENPPVIFYLCTALKPCIFPCAQAAKAPLFSPSFPARRKRRGRRRQPLPAYLLKQIVSGSRQPAQIRTPRFRCGRWRRSCRPRRRRRSRDLPSRS